MRIIMFTHASDATSVLPAAAFLDSHAQRWMPAFAAAVRAEARAPFYGAAARLLAAVVERG